MIRLATTENDARIHHYADVVKDPRFEWAGTINEPYDESDLEGIDGLIISCDNYLPSRIATAACGKLGIPVFHILDGVVDWRTTYQNAKYDARAGGVPLFQPLIADHVFTLGPLQKLQMNWLGNTNVYPTGLPRLDSITRHPCRIGSITGEPSLLVTTANTPWTTDPQRERLTKEFRNLKGQLRNNFQTTYRISQSLADSAGISPDNSGSAREALEKCDALITTPSTMAVEAMLTGVPTLIFDPFALPVFTPSAWTATSWQSIIASLPSLLAPTKTLAAYQDALCKYIAVGDGNATQRIADTIVSVVENREHEISTPSEISPSEESNKIDGLSATIAALGTQLNEAHARIQEIDTSIARPTLRFTAKGVARFIRHSLRPKP